MHIIMLLMQILILNMAVPPSPKCMTKGIITPLPILSNYHHHSRIKASHEVN
jgi:hypothetical protein